MAQGQLSILLFTTREPTASEVRERGGWGKLFAFRGGFQSGGHEVAVPTTGARAGNKLIRFKLIPVADIPHEQLPKADDVVDEDMLSSRQELLEESRIARRGVISVVEYRCRSARIRSYALWRASGVCEACGCVAPFLDAWGKPFLEVHHLQRLADDGPDAPLNVIAICPNCHRKAHYAADRECFKAEMVAAVREVEANIEKRRSG